MNDIIKLYQEAVNIINVLLNDLQKIINIVDIKCKELENSTQREFDKEMPFWFRMANRQVFSIIEATCYSLKQISLKLCHKKGKKLKNNDIQKIKERRLNGRPYFLKLEDNIQFTFKKLTYAWTINFKLNCNNRGWLDLIKAKDKRNGLAHPKRYQDIDMNAHDYNKLANGMYWFTNEFKRFNEELEKQKSSKIIIPYFIYKR